MQTLNRLLLAGVVIVLSACGGGGGGGSATPPSLEVTPEASASAAGLVGYVTTLSVTDAEDREPVGIASFNPQQPDDSEPLALN